MAKRTRMEYQEYTNSVTFSKALWDIAVGRKLGSGAFRDVFVCAFDTSLVLKIQRDPNNFDNVIEWETWQAYGGDDRIGNWLAPCVSISASGDILIQARTYPALEFPKELPSFLTDFKTGNYGTIGTGKKKRFVCHDYGNIVVPKLNPKLRKANWWVV